MTFLVRWLSNALAIWVAMTFLSGIGFEQTDADGTGRQVLTLAFIALVFTIVNAFIKPIVQLLSLPLLVVTLGLFTFVVNALMLQLTSWITGATSYGLTVDGFWSAVWASIVISIVNWAIGTLARGNRAD